MTAIVIFYLCILFISIYLFLIFISISVSYFAFTLLALLKFTCNCTLQMFVLLLLLLLLLLLFWPWWIFSRGNCCCCFSSPSSSSSYYCRIWHYFSFTTNQWCNDGIIWTISKIAAEDIYKSIQLKSWLLCNRWYQQVQCSFKILTLKPSLIKMFKNNNWHVSIGGICVVCEWFWRHPFHRYTTLWLQPADRYRCTSSSCIQQHSL